MGRLAIMVSNPFFSPSPRGRRIRRLGNLLPSRSWMRAIRDGPLIQAALAADAASSAILLPQGEGCVFLPPEPRQEFHRLGLGAGGGGAADLIVAALDLADAVDLLLERPGGAPAFARGVPVDGHEI